MSKKKEVSEVLVDQEYAHLNVSFQEATTLFKLASAANLPIMLYGSPGVGKTSLPRQIYRELGYDSCIVFTPSQDDVIDWKLPYLDITTYTEKENTITEKIAKFAVSERLPRTGRHIICIDEINTASMSLQPTLYSLVLERRVGDFVLPPGNMVCATGNRESDNAAAQPMSTALKDRLAIACNLVPEVNEWCNWAAVNQIHPSVVGFVRSHPGALHGINHEDVVAGCTPRSLEQLSRAIIANDNYGKNSSNPKFNIDSIENK